MGFVRDLLVARLFGAGAIADAFFVAFRIPNLLRSFVAEGALTSAFVPIFAGELQKGDQAARAVIRAVSGLLLLTTLLLAGLGIIWAPEIIQLIAPGFDRREETATLCIRLTRIMLPFITCVSLVAMLNGALNSLHIFGASALAQVWMNLVLIAGAWIAAAFPDQAAAEALAWSVLAGGVVQVIAQFPALHRAGLSIMPSAKILTPATRQLLRLMLPAVLGATVYQIQIFMNTMLASFLREGSIAWLFYADRLVQLPIGIFSVALASVLLPALSHASIQGNDSDFSQHLSDALRFTSFIVIPTAAFIFVFSEPLISLLFERGNFSQQSTVQTALAVRSYTLGLWAVSCHSMLARAFIARRDTFTPTAIGAAALLITLVLSLIFMGSPVAAQSGWLYSQVVSMQSLLPAWAQSIHLGHAGLALASSISSFCSLLALLLLMPRRLMPTWEPLARATLSALLSALVMVAVVKALIPCHTNAYQLLAALPLCAVSLTGAMWITKNRELKETFALISRIVKGQVPGR